MIIIAILWKQSITNFKESQLLANNIGIIDRPSVITDCTPSFIDTDFHPTLQICCTSLESDRTLLAELWMYYTKLLDRLCSKCYRQLTSSNAVNTSIFTVCTVVDWREWTVNQSEFTTSASRIINVDRSTSLTIEGIGTSN